MKNKKENSDNDAEWVSNTLSIVEERNRISSGTKEIYLVQIDAGQTDRSLKIEYITSNVLKDTNEISFSGWQLPEKEIKGKKLKLDLSSQSWEDITKTLEKMNIEKETLSFPWHTVYRTKTIKVITDKLKDK